MDDSEIIAGLAESIQKRFDGEHRVRSYREFLQEVREQPYRLMRSAAQYLRDMYEYFGGEPVTVLGREINRHKLFDGLAGDPDEQRVAGQEFALDGIYRIVRNFATEGRADRLILMHGPNGSSKTTIADLIFKGLEAYSRTPEGVLYKFSWVFPKSSVRGRGLGFTTTAAAGGEGELDSYAYLEPDDIASVVSSDLKTNPIYLVPRENRAEFLQELFGDHVAFPHNHILRGDIGTKSRAIFDALLTAHQGNWREVMRYVRVERFNISRRYRCGAISIEPQGNVDAEARQVTADMNLQNLPAPLQNLRLYELAGDLVDANRGLVEYSDFLKRNPELNKYMLTTSEKGTIRVPGAVAHLDLVMIGSANEKQLLEFKARPEFSSFKGRIELICVPYLLEYDKEVDIYRDEIESIAKRCTIAPHTPRTAALFAMLTRLWRPEPSNYDEPLKSVIGKLTPLAKALLYQGRDPADLVDLTADEVKVLRNNLQQIASEYRVGVLHPKYGVVYEGRFGISPREMKTVLLDASYRSKGGCFTPMMVLDQLRELVCSESDSDAAKTVYDFLKIEANGEYNRPARFIEEVERALVRVILREMRESMALVEESEYDRRFEEYFRHVIAYNRKGQVTDPSTGEERDPDTGVLQGVEKLIETGDDTDLFRKNLMSRIGAFSVNNPGKPVNYRELFPDFLRALRKDFYTRQQEAVREVENDLLRVDSPDWDALPAERRSIVETTFSNMEKDCGYDRECALEMTRFAITKSREGEKST